MPPTSPSLAVVDVETTGMYPNRSDRVVEIAVILIDLDGNPLREFCSLVNPQRSVGPTFVHGIRAHDVASAPTFAEIAAPLVESLQGAVALAGHNVGFDWCFLKSEFLRIGAPLTLLPLVDTLKLAGGGKLAKCCRNHGIEPDGPLHHALTDARMTAKLLALLLSKRPRLKSNYKKKPPIAWPTISIPPKPPLPRGQLHEITPPTPAPPEPTLFDFLDKP